MLCLSSHASTKINLSLYLYKNGKYCSSSNLIPPHISKIILQQHFFTGSDCSSSFLNHGKKSIFLKLIKLNHNSIGESLPITGKVVDDLKQLTKGVTSMAEARDIKYNILNKKTTVVLSPHDNSLASHSARPNYLTTIFKPDAPEPPFNDGWFTNNVNKTGVTDEQEEDSD